MPALGCPHGRGKGHRATPLSAARRELAHKQAALGRQRLHHSTEAESRGGGVVRKFSLAVSYKTAASVLVRLNESAVSAVGSVD